MLKLYCAPFTFSTCVVAALNEGVHWEPIPVDVAGGGQTKPDYHKINPKGRVPVLVTPEGLLTETGAILEYIGETALPKLVPVDALQRARMREVIYYLASTMHVNHAHARRGSRWANTQGALDEMAAKVPETMAASSAFIESQITGPYLFGPDPMLADFYPYTISTCFGRDGVDITDYPKLAAFKSAMEERPSVQKARADGYFG